MNPEECKQYFFQRFCQIVQRKLQMRSNLMTLNMQTLKFFINLQREQKCRLLKCFFQDLMFKKNSKNSQKLRRINNYSKKKQAQLEPVFFFLSQNYCCASWANFIAFGKNNFLAVLIFLNIVSNSNIKCCE